MYKPINGWTKQSIIDHIKKNFKGKSVMFNNDAFKSESCAYRSPYGRKCAVGLFIPDELYIQDMEGEMASEICYAYPELNQFMPFKPDVLDELQAVHDTSRNSATLNNILNWIDIKVSEGANYGL